MIRLSGKKGFTLIELLLTFAILAFCLCGILLTYINMFILSDLARDLTTVTNLVQEKMEETKKNDFDSLVNFSLGFDENLIFEGQDGYDSAKKKGTVVGEVTVLGYSDLKKLKVYACFKTRAANKLSRVIGNDMNSCTSSPLEVVNLIAR